MCSVNDEKDVSSSHIIYDSNIKENVPSILIAKEKFSPAETIRQHPAPACEKTFAEKNKVITNTSNFAFMIFSFYD